MSKKSFLFFCYCMMFLSPACLNNDREDLREVDTDNIYFDYNIVGDEESNLVTVKLQYRIGSPGGKTWLIPDPGKVEFDGEALEADSSRMNGVWYEVTRPLDEFEGPHQIVFTHLDKSYKEQFDFKVMSLKTKVPPVIKRGDLVFELQGLVSGDRIRVLLTDTGFYSRGIDRIDTVRNGRISITRRELENVKDGPVIIEFYRDTEENLSETTDRGGRLAISYGLRRVFELRDTINRSSPARTQRDG